MTVSGELTNRDHTPAASEPAYRLPAAQVTADLGVDPAQGLSAAEAEARIERYGRNELPSAPPVPAWRRLLAQFNDPLTILLLVATVVSFVAWVFERETPIPYEAIVILAIVVLNGILGFVQENRAEQAVAALQAMASPTARVLRDERPQDIPAGELVPGDILLLEEGDTVPADARVLASTALRAAEAALTGESTPVSKITAPIPEEVGIGDRDNLLFSGTAIAAGRGRAVVVATGPATELGKIAGRLQETDAEATPLQRELEQVGKLLGIAVIGIAVVVSATILLSESITSISGLIAVLLLAVSLAVAAVPEGLTAVTTIVLSLGMQRMAERNVIVRKLSAVETLGSTTEICSDKTGTLTRNEMTVRVVATASGRTDLTGIGYEPVGEARRDGEPLEAPATLNEVRRTLTAAALANNATLQQQERGWSVLGDPTEGALIVAAQKVGLTPEALGQRFERVGEIPFSSERKLMSTAHLDRDAQDDASRDGAYLLAKGAPDVLLSRCAHEWVGGDDPTAEADPSDGHGRLRGGTAHALTDERRHEILQTVERLAAEALRTLGVAFHPAEPDAVADGLSEDQEQELIWLGIIGMIDPPRPEAADAVRLAKLAGIRPIMITGDHPATAAAIAAELGIVEAGTTAATGADIERADDARLREMVRETSVYARVAPEHKLRIVHALKSNGRIVAMTGDGVNDAPALKAADIGVAMGITGTDVSKGAADMILADDNFASIVAAVEEGRSIFANIQKFLLFLLSSNVGEVLVMFLGVMLAGVLGLSQAGEGDSRLIAPLLAVQILWINLLTDAAPALALGVEPSDPTRMGRPPRDPSSSVISWEMWAAMLLIGTIVAVGTLGVLDWALPGGLIPGNESVERARTLAFTTLVFFQLVNVFNARSDRESAFSRPFSNRWIWVAIGISVLLQVAVIYVPFLQSAFSTAPLSLADWLICLAVSSFVLWPIELLKLIARHRDDRSSGQAVPNDSPRSRSQVR
jgi:Ca2+-transporting ATPase